MINLSVVPFGGNEAVKRAGYVVGSAVGIVLLAGVVASLGLGGCAKKGKAGAKADGASGAAAFVMPDFAKPAPALAPLAFMSGRWIGQNLNKTINEEHWMQARGQHMLGTFRQVRRDGMPAFVEVSLITVAEGRITLRTRHLHTKLEVPEKEREPWDLKLSAADGKTATFVVDTTSGENPLRGLLSITYTLTSPSTLDVTFAYDPASREKTFTLGYRRVE